jgi:hypothetical protein
MVFTLVMGVVAIYNHMAVPPIEIDVNIIEDILINGRLEVNVISKELKSKL